MPDMRALSSRRWLIRQWVGWIIVCWAMISVQILYREGFTPAALLHRWVWTPWAHLSRTMRQWVTAYREFWHRQRELVRQNRSLRQKMFYYQQIEIQYHQLLRELRRFRPLYERWRPAVGVWARVFFQGGHPVRTHTVLIDRGAKHGVRVYDAVLTPHGLVGVVTTVGPQVSHIRLITHPLFRCGARAGHQGPVGIVFGQGIEGQLLLRYTPHNRVIPRGTPVFTNGMEGVLPAGIPIGSIRERFWMDTGEVAYWVQPAVDLSRLEWVLVQTPREPVQ